MIPYLQIRPNLLLYYQLPETSFRKSKLKNLLNRKERESQVQTSLFDLKNTETYTGQMTDGSIKRLRKAINTLAAIAKEKQALNYKTRKHFKFKLNFITLTLPSEQGNITDKEIKRQVLDVWIKAAKRRFKLNSYIWKAERQKNGNLHFHFTTDTYIPFDQLRDTWNDRLERLGFISAFERKHGHRHPNSTDVHATHKVKNLANYLVKYLTKANKGEDKIEGKMWDCSENLKAKLRCETVVDSQTFNWLESIRERYPEQLKKMDQCSLLWLTEKQFQKEVTGNYLNMYNEWIERVRSYVKPSIKRKLKDKELINRQALKQIKPQLELKLTLPIARNYKAPLPATLTKYLISPGPTIDKVTTDEKT